MVAVVSEAVGVPMGFKDNLRRLRESKGWSQAEAARQVGAPFRSYVNWELGLREPRMAALVRLAAAFGVTLDQLLEGVGKADEESAEEKPKPRRRKK